ncbi:MAG: agmatinase [Bacteroidales bacterium]|nr:agmatinase [Bacteroidales bacterium]
MKKFLGEENIYDDPDTSFGVVVPVPFEFSTSYGKGASKGPKAIIDASEYVELYDEILEMEAFKHGILTANYIEHKNDPQDVLRQIQQQVKNYINDNKFIVALGGEHSISSAVVAAHNEKYSDLSVLQLDAHADLRDQYEGSKYSHASVMKRIWELNCNIVQCGIRALSKEEADFIKENNIDTFFAHDLKKKDNWDEVLNKLGENVYLTIDVDFFDPSIMPATGTPEPGGFYWDETMGFLINLFTARNIVGCDVVELSPIKEMHHADFMIAKLVYKLFGMKLRSNIDKF